MKNEELKNEETIYGEETNLISLSDLGVTVQNQDDKDFDNLVEKSTYLPRIQLYASSSEAVKQEKIGQGRFGVSVTKDSVEDLGKAFDAIPLSYRFKAVQFTGDEIIASYDPQSEIFKSIQAQSDTEDSGCMFGIEFMLWLTDSSKFVTYHLSSKSARREAKPLRSMLGQAVTIEVELKKGKKYSYHIPKVMKCSSAVSNLPDPALMKVELERFKNTTGTEASTETEMESGRR